ncbi:MAG: hypothetical protein Q4D43_08785 [Clostridia bacterium]|nr:hypothetical protein [Clostridia bacterium]
MENKKTEPCGNAENTRSGEAELLAEILTRMDEKQKRDTENAAPEARAASGKNTIDLVELFFFLLSKLHYILLGMVLGAVLLGMYANARSVPIYTATSKLYIVGETGNSIIADLQIGTVLTMDYQEVFKTWEVHQMVNDELGTDFSYSMLQSMLTISNPEDTRILYITVRYPDAEMAAKIANAYGTAAKRFITEIMQTDEPSTFSIALVPSVASGVGVTSWIIRGSLLGTVLVCGLLVLIFLLDTRPKTPEDIQRYANIPTLSVIPASPSFIGGKKRARKGREQ